MHALQKMEFFVETDINDNASLLIDCGCYTGRTRISKMMPLDKQHTCSTCTQSKATPFAPKIKLEIRPTLSKCKKGIYMYLFEKLYIKNRIKLSI